VRNALACAAVCSSVGVPVSRAAEALSEFTGVRRRFDILLREPVTVIDDYAHHPTEVETVIQSARQVFAGRKLVCVFQPHQHSRLRSLLDGFAGVLRTSDETLVTRVYRCRDSDADAQAIESGALVEAVRARGGLCRYTPEYEHVLEALDQAALDGSVVAFLGAGTVTEFAKSFAERRGGRLLVAPRPVWCPGGEARSACS
jgi:UDP-N-acetylmuramate--alanine ligase